MASYAERRDQEYLSRLAVTIGEFQHRYRAGRPTIFLFPGGFGSQLRRANERFDESASFTYSKCWLDCGIFRRDPNNLRLQSNGDDLDWRYVVPDGGVDFDGELFREQPYLGFAGWCAQNQINLLVFGWDWRLGINHSATFFLDAFLPMFEAMLDGVAPHPLDDFTLVGHSAGGMVVKAILNQPGNEHVQRMKRAITVGTPFYGYGEQAQCFIRGNEILNPFMAGMSGRDGGQAVISLACSMPGAYEFLHLDKATYDANVVDFQHDPHGYHLVGYPSMDMDNPGEAADPYEDPQITVNGKYRYPMIYGFDSALLERGRNASHDVSRPLGASVAEKLFNIRGVQEHGGVQLDETPNRLTWERVAADFDPFPTRPLNRPINVIKGPGDGVQAAWGTRLLGLPDPERQVITVVGEADEIEHMSLMNAHRVQREIGILLGVDAPVLLEAGQVVAATRKQLDEFLEGFHTYVNERQLAADDRQVAIKRYLARYEPTLLHKLLRRAHLDFLKG